MSENTPGRSEGQPEQPKFVPAAPPVAPAGNAYTGYVPTKLPAGLAIASLVLGIVSLIGFIPVISFVTCLTAITGLVLGIIALRKVAKGTGGGKGLAIGGVVVSAVALIISILMSIVTIMSLMMLQECNQNGVRHSDGTVTCNVGGANMTISPDGKTVHD